jgi:hypothetical protein
MSDVPYNLSIPFNICLAIKYGVMSCKALHFNEKLKIKAVLATILTKANYMFWKLVNSFEMMK